VTVEISRDPWATLDDLLGIEIVDAVDEGAGRGLRALLDRGQPGPDHVARLAVRERTQVHRAGRRDHRG
jgi:hypothetical protein